MGQHHSHIQVQCLWVSFEQKGVQFQAGRRGMSQGQMGGVVRGINTFSENTTYTSP